jgi:hypothetical protein
MNTKDPYLMMRWNDLEIAWRMLAAPDKLSEVAETLEAVHALSQNVGPEKVVFSMIAATAWLTDDGTVLKKD